MSSAAVLLRDYKWDVDALVSDYTDDPDGTLASHNVTRPTAAAERMEERIQHFTRFSPPPPRHLPLEEGG